MQRVAQAEGGLAQKAAADNAGPVTETKGAMQQAIQQLCFDARHSISMSSPAPSYQASPALLAWQSAARVAPRRRQARVLAGRHVISASAIQRRGHALGAPRQARRCMIKGSRGCCYSEYLSLEEADTWQMWECHTGRASDGLHSWQQAGWPPPGRSGSGPVSAPMTTPAAPVTPPATSNTPPDAADASSDTPCMPRH